MTLPVYYVPSYVTYVKRSTKISKTILRKNKYIAAIAIMRGFAIARLIFPVYFFNQRFLFASLQ